MSRLSPRDRAVCIYCLTDSNSSPFSREHIIPQCVGGTLFVDNMVCERCNSALGHEVDCQILKLPEILAAMDALGLPYDREGILRSYYDSALMSETDRLKAAPTKNGFRLITQDLKNGSRITPGHKTPVDTLYKALVRDCALANRGLTTERIARLLQDLSLRFDQADNDQEAECPELGLRLVKRSAALRGIATPKAAAAIDRVVGKVALEWLFSCFGKAFVENAPWSVNLRNLVCGGKETSPISVFRSKPLDQEIRKSHSIYVYLDESFTKVAVAFFGSIEFTLIAPSMPIVVIEAFRTGSGTPDAIGIAFEQDLTDGAKSFFALRENGSSRFLGNL